MLNAIRFRVQNYRNIDDTGWIPVERVTSLVGRNESGKTALLKALHKFNPATPEPYNPQREFPRDRYTHDFKDPAEWPVCSVAFEIKDTVLSDLQNLTGDKSAPNEVICTRFYDDSLDIEFNPAITDDGLSPVPVTEALKSFAQKSRRLKASSTEQAEQEEIQALRTQLATWASDWQQKFDELDDLRGDEGCALLSTLRTESDQYANPETADIVESLQEVVAPLVAASQQPSTVEQARELINSRLPVFIYFENYGILDSAIYLPRFLEDLEREPDNSRVRTVNAMFKHVGLTVKEIADLGNELAQQARARGQEPTAQEIATDQERKEARSIKLNSASLDITHRFNEWYGQRRHSIDYQADGDYFRIWVADDRRPGVKIELEGRSTGFQWFFSFYLVFLVESEEGHKNAILLLDEPGLHLHPTAQQELITFFDSLAQANQLLYTTHSPFLIDGERLHRVRPVTEDKTGHSHVSVETWPSDRETIFPLQAAAGYAMVRGLFQHKDNVLVEGMSDYYYLYALSAQCRLSKKDALPDSIYITPCGGTKNVGHIASLFLGQEVRPLVLLDGDDAGRVRMNALIKELYAEHTTAILMLDDAIGNNGKETEIEDIFGENIVLDGISKIINQKVKLTQTDRTAGSLPNQIRNWATRRNVTLPDGWKASTAIHLVSEWATHATQLPEEVLDRAALLFKTINDHFEHS